MSPTSRTLRFALLAASTSLAAGGALLPTGALAAPAPMHTIALPAEDGGDGEDADGGHTGRDGRNGGWNRHRGEDGRHDDGGTPRDDPADGDATEPADTEPADSEPGIVAPEHCNDPRALPGLCVNGKPLPKGDNKVTIPQGTLPCLAIDTAEQCADRQKPRVPSPTGSSTAGLAV